MDGIPGGENSEAIIRSLYRNPPVATAPANRKGRRPEGEGVNEDVCGHTDPKNPSRSCDKEPNHGGRHRYPKVADRTNDARVIATLSGDLPISVFLTLLQTLEAALKQDSRVHAASVTSGNGDFVIKAVIEAES